MPVEYVWVVGGSAVGKKTFIRELLKNPSLRVRFRIPPSFVPLGPGFRDPPERGVTAEWVLAQKDAADTFVIKWQAQSDAEVLRLRELAPSAKHRVVFLRRDSRQMVRDLHDRDGPPGPPNPSLEEEAAKWDRWVAASLNEARARVQRGVAFELGDANSRQYQIMESQQPPL